MWSLGVLLYILVSACPPFDGADDSEILRSVQKLSYSLDSIFWFYSSSIDEEGEPGVEGLDKEDFGAGRAEDNCGPDLESCLDDW